MQSVGRYLFFSLTLISWISGYAHAELTRLEVQSTKPWLGGRYEKLQGRAHFTIDPQNPANRRIVDIALGPRNAEGRVEFSTDFVMVRPSDPKKSRHAVLVEVPNRGRTQANGSFFSTAPRSNFDLLKLDEASFSDAFVFDQGFTVAWLGWQFDLPNGQIRAQLPTADVHGLVRQTAIGNGVSRAWSLAGPDSYCAADADQPGAKMIVQSRIDQPGETLPRSAWTFARMESGSLMPDACQIILHEPMKMGQIYEVVYQGANPAIAGLALAAFRDFAAYLKSDGTATRVLGYGYSQSGRFLRDFLYRGFNADEHGKPAFDGLFIASAGAGRGSFDHRFAMPGEAGNSVLSILRPVDQPPFDDTELLEAAVRSKTVPKIFYTYSSTEYWARFGSLAYTSLDATKELPLNPQARLYFFPGTPHSHGPFPPVKQRGASWANAANYASSGWSFRALLLDLDEWVAKGTKPPDSAYPHLTKDLVPREQVKFPHVPGVEFPPYMPRDWRLDFGPEFATKGIIANEPPVMGEPFKVLVPQVDQDGIDQGGIAVPQVAVPLGTFTGWNYELPVLSNLDYLAGLIGSFIPFPLTAEDRKASGDSRRSIAERYPSRDEYLKQVREATEALVSRRLARREDTDAIVAESAQHWDYLVAPH
jgi:hypothetical protein